MAHLPSLSAVTRSLSASSNAFGGSRKNSIGSSGAMRAKVTFTRTTDTGRSSPVLLSVSVTGNSVTLGSLWLPKIPSGLPQTQ
jgi:hypothetical protein